jgi:formate/nitrite transporter FocA (FNT family)
LTPILPLLLRKDADTLKNVLRLWAVVFLANMIGCVIVAGVLARTHAFEPHVRQAFFDIAQEAMKPSWGTTLLRGVFAGWLIALMVWLLPFAETARVLVIVIITYVVGLGQFSHIIAGSVEVFTLPWAGLRGWGETLTGFVLPTLLGNILGGVTLVAALNHAQVVAGDSGGEDV